MCGCQERREALNAWEPGLGDRVATVAEPVKKTAQLLLDVLAALLGWVLADVALEWMRRKRP